LGFSGNIEVVDLVGAGRVKAIAEAAEMAEVYLEIFVLLKSE
jgi:hypothetical protein